MSRFKRILQKFDFAAQSKAKGIPIWQNPQFLFTVMGFLIIVAIILFYIFGTRYIEDPAIATLIISALTGILFTIDFIITQSFEVITEASRMKTEFIEIVSHQLRTPLSSLKWTTELLASGRVGGANNQQAEYLGILGENCDRMIELIKNLLAASRIEDESTKINKEKVNISNLIKDVIKEHEVLAKKSQITIKSDIDDNLPELYTDLFHIKTIMENLVSNAISYSRPQLDTVVIEPKEIKVSLKNRKNSIYFEVQDHGVGVPKDDQKYLFQKFFRSKNTLRYKTQGSGLGLYIVKSIVKKLGGKIGFRSEEGEGSVFWFILPIIKS